MTYKGHTFSSREFISEYLLSVSRASEHDISSEIIMDGLLKQNRYIPQFLKTKTEKLEIVKSKDVPYHKMKISDTGKIL